MHIDPISPLSRLTPMTAAAPAASPQSGFATLLHSAIQQHQQAHNEATAAIRRLAAGQAQDLHSVALSVAQADLTFRFLLELRNRLTEAYQEITRTQI